MGHENFVIIQIDLIKDISYTRLIPTHVDTAVELRVTHAFMIKALKIYFILTLSKMPTFK